MFIVFSSTRSPDGVVLGGLPTGLGINNTPYRNRYTSQRQSNRRFQVLYHNLNTSFNHLLVSS